MILNASFRLTGRTPCRFLQSLKNFHFKSLTIQWQLEIYISKICSIENHLAEHRTRKTRSGCNFANHSANSMRSLCTSIIWLHAYRAGFPKLFVYRYQDAISQTTQPTPCEVCALQSFGYTPIEQGFPNFLFIVPLNNLWNRSCTPKIGEDQKRGVFKSTESCFSTKNRGRPKKSLHVQRILFFFRCKYNLLYPLKIQNVLPGGTSTPVWENGNSRRRVLK